MKKTKSFFERVCLLWTFLPFLMLCTFTGQVQNAPRTITGKVVSANNLPVAGATITNKTGNKSFATDGNGTFSLSAATGDVLIISSVGFQ